MKEHIQKHIKQKQTSLVKQHLTQAILEQLNLIQKHMKVMLVIPKHIQKPMKVILNMVKHIQKHMKVTLVTKKHIQHYTVQIMIKYMKV